MWEEEKSRDVQCLPPGLCDFPVTYVPVLTAHLTFLLPFASHAPWLFSFLCPSCPEPLFLHILKDFLHFIFICIQFYCRFGATEVVNIAVLKSLLLLNTKNVLPSDTSS